MNRIRFKLFLIFFIINAFPATTQVPSSNPLEFAVENYMTDPDTAFFLAKKEYLDAHTNQDPLKLALSAQILGKILFHQGSFHQASEYLQEAGEIYQKNNHPTGLAHTFIWLGAVYQYAKQLPLSMKYYQQAMEIFKKENYLPGIAESYGWMGHYFEKVGQPDTALLLQNKSLEIYRELKDPSGLARIYENIGSIYEDIAQYDSAWHYFQLSYMINKELGNIPNILVLINNLGDIHRKTKRYPLALLYTDSALHIAKKYEILYQVRSAYRDKAKTYELMGRMDSAFYYQEIAYDLYAQIFSMESARRIAQLQSIYESERKENQIMLLEKSQAYNRIVRVSLMLALGGFVLIGGLLFYQQRQKMKQEKKINEQQEKIHATEHELIQEQLKNVLLNEAKLKAELDNKNLLEERLRQELTLKSQVLTSHTLQIIRKNNFLEELKTELGEIKKSDKNGRHLTVNNLISAINTNFARDLEWNDFQQVFEQVHSDFFIKLKEDFPDLSPTEIRLCSLLKLNLNSHDIASILNISQDSLRVARYRLRKKLNLDKNINLITFLINY